MFSWHLHLCYSTIFQSRHAIWVRKVCFFGAGLLQTVVRFFYALARTVFSDMAPRIFFIESDKDTRVLFEAYLKVGGYRCMSFSAGGDALAEAERLAKLGRVPSLLLLDFYLPDINGLEVLKAIKDLPAWAEVPCLFLSSARDPEIIMEAHSLGAADFLPKSILPETLLDRVEKVLSQSRHLRVITETPEQVNSTLIDQRYQIIQPMGVGGMSKVFLVQDIATKVYRVLKMLSPTSPGQLQVEIERFRREIRAQIELEHPNLVTVHDMGIFGHLFYYTMDYLPGGSLLDRMTQSILSIEESITIVAKVASVLQFVHDQKILHRDLKPENIIFSEDNEPVLIDFGLVLRMRSGENRLTGEYQVLGTTGFMAPERMRSGLVVDHRSDIFSLGALLYTMLTGQDLPHAHLAIEDAYEAIRQGLPSPQTFRSEIPKRVAKICLRALQFNPQKRFSSCEEMQTMLLREL